MSIVRQDAWTNDEDLVLAEVVLRHIREGSTQLAAFEEVGERLSRTSAACGFRWNASIRKKYDAAIAIAKKQRKNLKKTKLDDQNSNAEEFAAEVPSIKEVEVALPVNEAVEKNKKTTEVSIDDVIEYLHSIRESFATHPNLIDENKELQERISLLTDENKRLLKELSEVSNNYDIMKQDYKLLIDIMNRAKQLSVTESN